MSNARTYAIIFDTFWLFKRLDLIGYVVYDLTEELWWDWRSYVWDP